MNFLFSNNEDDDNFDSFITQNLKPEQQIIVNPSNKKQRTSYQSIDIPTQLQFLCTPKSPEAKITQSTHWEMILEYLKFNDHSIDFNDKRSKLPYPLNQFYLQKISEFKNQKIDAIICEVHFIEAFGDTTEIILKDQSGSCKASILSDLLTDETDEKQPILHNPVIIIQKKDQVLLYLENVTVFSPNQFEISIIINRNNIKLAIF